MPISYDKTKMPGYQSTWTPPGKSQVDKSVNDVYQNALRNYRPGFVSNAYSMDTEQSRYDWLVNEAGIPTIKDGVYFRQLTNTDFKLAGVNLTEVKAWDWETFKYWHYRESDTNDWVGFQKKIELRCYKHNNPGWANRINNDYRGSNSNENIVVGGVGASSSTSNTGVTSNVSYTNSANFSVITQYGSKLTVRNGVVYQGVDGNVAASPYQQAWYDSGRPLADYDYQEAKQLFNSNGTPKTTTLVATANNENIVVGGISNNTTTSKTATTSTVDPAVANAAKNLTDAQARILVGKEFDGDISKTERDILNAYQSLNIASFGFGGVVVGSSGGGARAQSEVSFVTSLLKDK